MKFSYIALALLAVLGSANAATDTRNPFDPTGAKLTQSKSSTRLDAASLPPGAGAPMPPLLLPPPLPYPPSPAPSSQEIAHTAPSDAAASRKKPKQTAMSVTAAGCKLKAKQDSVAAPAYGGIVTIALEGGSRDCVSAVMVEEPWLEAKELSDPSSIRLAVDANDSSSPRQSNIVIANAGRSVTVTLVQEGRSPRAR
jgi:hypothetical protein